MINLWLVVLSWRSICVKFHRNCKKEAPFYFHWKPYPALLNEAKRQTFWSIAIEFKFISISSACYRLCLLWTSSSTSLVKQIIIIIPWRSGQPYGLIGQQFCKVRHDYINFVVWNFWSRTFSAGGPYVRLTGWRNWSKF